MTQKKHEIQKKILEKFLYTPTLSYSQIWDKTLCSSSLFDYHFQQLVTNELICKKDSIYTITSKGSQWLTEVDGKTLEVTQKPVACAFVLVHNIKENTVLLSIRKKQPYFDTINIVGGKIEYGETSLDAAKRELFEETGITAQNLELRLITENQTVVLDDNNAIEHSIIGFFYYTTDFSGTLISKTREGENIWIRPENIAKYPQFPDIPFITSHILSKKPCISAFIQRVKDKDTFVDVKITKNSS